MSEKRKTSLKAADLFSTIPLMDRRYNSGRSLESGIAREEASFEGLFFADTNYVRRRMKKRHEIPIAVLSNTTILFDMACLGLLSFE